jgi:hypothetical protein
MLELAQINDYDTFIDKGHYNKVKTPDGFKKTQNQIAQYQSMIDALQWIVTIRHFNINAAVMTMSEFHMSPRVEQPNSSSCTYRYPLMMKHASIIRVRTKEPDLCDLSDNVHDANLMHDIAMGRSVTGILHLGNKTPIEWFSKKQATVETATYGSEFVAARVCVEQIIDLRNTLRFLGVPVREKSYMFGDNKSVVDSSMQLNAKLHKRHAMLSFHRVRLAIAAHILSFYFLPGDDNPADILSKNWGYTQIQERLKSLLFWRGDTADIMAVQEE